MSDNVLGAISFTAEEAYADSCMKGKLCEWGAHQQTWDESPGTIQFKQGKKNHQFPTKQAKQFILILIIYKWLVLYLFVVGFNGITITMTVSCQQILFSRIIIASLFVFVFQPGLKHG